MSAFDLNQHLLSSKHLSEAPSLLHADRLIILGSLTKKQLPLLQYAFSQFSLPKRCVHIQGCRTLQSYSLTDELASYLQPDIVLKNCELDREMLEHALLVKA